MVNSQRNPSRDSFKLFLATHTTAIHYHATTRHDASPTAPGEKTRAALAEVSDQGRAWTKSISARAKQVGRVRRAVFSGAPANQLEAGRGLGAEAKGTDRGDPKLSGLQQQLS